MLGNDDYRWIGKNDGLRNKPVIGNLLYLEVLDAVLTQQDIFIFSTVISLIIYHCGSSVLQRWKPSRAVFGLQWKPPISKKTPQLHYRKRILPPSKEISSS